VQESKTLDGGQRCGISLPWRRIGHHEEEKSSNEIMFNSILEIWRITYNLRVLPKWKREYMGFKFSKS
jgi:hypothetical protein